MKSKVEFTINGKEFSVSDDIPADTSLNVFIREHAHLKGTKFMCLEGGCGACIVSVQSIHPTKKKLVSYSVNSCLVPIFACHGWAIMTVEGLGSKSTGYDAVQKRLAAANGTQCGYCSPGMVMNMHSLLMENPKITMKEVENSFGGNICRCTGYRPILDAFKSLASDAPPELINKLTDIEDMSFPVPQSENGKHEKCSCESFCKKICAQLCGNLCKTKDKLMSRSKVSLNFELDNGASWYKPSSVKEVMEILDMMEGKSYRYIAGNTGQGVYRIKEEPDAYIDLNNVPELHGHEENSDGITLGANISLTEAMALFYKLAKDKPNKYAYCQTLADHIDLIANVPVRNIGTFAGNISMKHQNIEFPSDIFLFLEMVGAQLLINEKTGMTKTVGLLEYLSMPMKEKLIVKILLPALNSSYITHSFKIMPRAQNAHAYVNAGFLLKVNKKNDYTVLEKPRIVFGGIDPSFLHATSTEEYLTGKALVDEKTLQGALEVLKKELKPDHIPPDASPDFRTGLALSLFYKFILSLDSDKITSRNKSGGKLLERGVSSGKQDFDTDRNVWPLNKPIPKVEALIQCSGEAEYSNDIPHIPGQLWGQLVLAERGAATITSIDASKALKMPGVVAFYSAKDIPGKNTFTPPGFLNIEDEPIFAEKVAYCGQAIGVIFADTHLNAIKAAKKVTVKYSAQKELIIDMRQIIKNNMKDRIKEISTITPKNKKTDIKHTIKGRWDLKTQYHYTMETPTCVAIPVEDHLEVYPATQWPAGVQEVIGLALNIPEHSITIQVRRLGGGYGGKITRSPHTGAVCALGAHLLKRPVRMVLSMETTMEWMGKRFPVFTDYEAGVNEDGEIQYLNADIYEDDGHSLNDITVSGTLHHLTNVYDTSVWNVKGYSVRTDTASNTWCRAPGSTEAISIIETIMDHIAKTVKKDPVSVRLLNMYKEDNPMPTMVDDIKKNSDYDKRVEDINKFNEENRWKKRGISLVPMNYPFQYWGAYYGMVSIYGMDGTVAVSHGAIEMGQGVNTKVAQVAAHILGIDLDMIKVKPVSNISSPNNVSTGGSLGSEAASYAVKVCCDVLNERLKPIRDELGSTATWKEIINKAYADFVNLNHSYMFTAKDDVKDYPIYGVVVTEVEVDILTGQYQTRRVDLIEDAGQSLSPDVDIGQVEGAFVMGLGYFTCEEIVLDSKSGSMLTNRTWNYKPPGAKDIPIDFRVMLRKNTSNPYGVLRSKATGEPPFCLSCSVTFAIRNALTSARVDAGGEDAWFDIEPPFTGERIWTGALNKTEQYTL